MGTANVRHFFYYYSGGGGNEIFMGDFDEELYLEKSPALWEVLNEIEPYLWREGETYPQNFPQTLDLFANGEIDLYLAFGPNEPSIRIEKGQFPETALPAILEPGTEVSTNYVAIPYNASSRAGALVLANFLASPECVFERSQPDVLGWMPTVTMSLLPEEWQQKFLEDVPLAIPADVLAAHSIPQVQSTWRVRLEKDWAKFVLQQ
jgi:ABC-type uncharacterized transport system YnjBCD substrate-binding protein